MLFAALIGLILTALFVLGFRRKGPWSSGIVFFLIVFLTSWAIGKLASPVGPHILGVYYLPYFAAALVVALLLAAAMPVRLHHYRRKIVEGEQGEPSTFEKVFDGFFWVFLFALLMLIVLGYAIHFFA